MSRNPNRDISTGAMWQNKRGSIAVEFALIGPALVLLLMAATDLSMAIHARAEVGNAARAGAEYAETHSFNSSSITNAVTSATSLSGVTATPTPSTFCGCATASGIAQQTCGTACAAGGKTGTYVSVTAQATYSPLFPTHWNPNPVNMSATVVTRTN
ncbi:MAG: TadE/TadG family type IV pilus assembly protein [Methylocella sp.]